MSVKTTSDIEYLTTLTIKSTNYDSTPSDITSNLTWATNCDSVTIGSVVHTCAMNAGTITLTAAVLTGTP